MTSQKDRRGPFRRMLEEQISARITNEISNVDRQRIRELIDVTNRSFLVTLSGGNLGPATADMTLQWCERGEIRSADVLVRTEAGQDGLLDLVIEDCPTELRFLCLLSGLFQFPSFQRHTEYLAEDKPRLPTVNVDLNQFEEEFVWLDGADDTSLAASSDDSDLFEQCRVDWQPGSTPEISLRAKADAGPFFGVIDASWEISKGNRKHESTAIAMVDYRENEWLGRSNLVWPKGIPKGKVVVRPMKRADMHLLDSQGIKDELSPLTNFLAVQNIRAWKVNQNDKCVRVSGITPSIFESNVDFVLRGVSATAPFEQQDFGLMWQMLEARVERQLVNRIKSDRYLRIDELKDMMQDIAWNLSRVKDQLSEMFAREDFESVYKFVWVVVENHAHKIRRGNVRQPKTLQDQDFKTSGDDNDITMFISQIEDSFDGTGLMIDRESFNHEWNQLKQLLNILDERSRNVLLKRSDNWTRKELAAELSVTEETVREIESKAMCLLKSVYGLRRCLKEFGFVDSGLITEEECDAVLRRRLGKTVKNTSDSIVIDRAEAIVDCVIAAKSLQNNRSYNQLTSAEMDQIDIWLQEFKFASKKATETTFADQSHDRFQGLGRRLHGQILLSRFEGNRKKMPETSRIYVEQRILMGISWPDVLNSLKSQKACNPMNFKVPSKALEPLDPLSVPRRVKELWDKEPSVVPKEFRILTFEELKMP